VFASFNQCSFFSFNNPAAVDENCKVGKVFKMEGKGYQEQEINWLNIKDFFKFLILKFKKIKDLQKTIIFIPNN